METCFLLIKTDNRTQGHSWALVRERCKLDVRKYAHCLSELKMDGIDCQALGATSVNVFKNKMDKYFSRSGYI